MVGTSNQSVPEMAIDNGYPYNWYPNGYNWSQDMA
jgi:hypothetical protein